MFFLPTKNEKNPKRELLHPWEPANGPWEHIHIDFAGPMKDWWYLILWMHLMDGDKWMEILLTKLTTTTWYIKQLYRLFATFGFPHILNQITELNQYLKHLKIIHRNTRFYTKR